MTESQWRFLSAITARVPTDRIIELRLFPVIRQGGMESGAAVVAVEEIVDLPPGEVAPDGTPPAGASGGSEIAAGDGSPSNAEIAIDLGPLFSPPERDEAAGPEMEGGEFGEDGPAFPPQMTGVASDEEVKLPSGGTRGVSVDVRPAAAGDVNASADMTAQSDESESVPDSIAADEGLSLRPQVKRYSVLAARYRLTLKGPERGAWDFEITHEADAPLETVERVARGVARRSGDVGQPEHLSASDIRATLAQPWWSGAQ